ncbi:MAG TPA: hypothetical protein VNI57_12380 [Candidatus Saccharimonadales bacterium]|nr:hypothetical protein [Candidatus Saccharimonadales bacterium]
MRKLGLTFALMALSAGVLWAGDESGKGVAAAREAETLYRQGAYAAALKKYEEAMAAGTKTPEILYQAGNCYRVAMSDQAKELELKKQAVPMLEQEIAGGQAGIAAHYYLAAIYIHNLADPVKGVAVARKGVALVEKNDPTLENPVENLYRAARLYEFLGQNDKESAMDQRFQDAAAVSPTPVDRAAVQISREKLAAEYMRTEKYDKAAGVYAALLKVDPLRDDDRHQWGLALLRAGKPLEAAKAWNGATSDEYRTELAYLSRVAVRYDESGRPQSCATAPGAATLTDDALSAKVLEAGAKLRQYKEKAESEFKAQQQSVIDEQNRHRAEILALSPEERKARWEKKEAEEKASGKADAEAGGDSAKKQEPSLTGRVQPTHISMLPEKSDAWKAAEKDFFCLMTEYVKRGHLIRMYAFQNGMADLIFR